MVSHDQNRWLADNAAERWHKIIKLMDFCSNWIERALAEIFTAATQPLWVYGHVSFHISCHSWYHKRLGTTPRDTWGPSVHRRGRLHTSPQRQIIMFSVVILVGFMVLEFLQISGDESRMSWNWNIKGQSHTEGWSVFFFIQTMLGGWSGWSGWSFFYPEPHSHGAQKRDPNGNGDDGDAPHKDGDVLRTTTWGCRNHGSVAPDAETWQGYAALRVQ